MLELTTDGGTTWTDAGAYVTGGGYTGTIATGHGNPLEGRPAWTGSNSGYGQVTLNLTAYAAGQSLRFRHRLGTDVSIAGTGWWIDDVRLVVEQACGR